MLSCLHSMSRRVARFDQTINVSSCVPVHCRGSFVLSAGEFAPNAAKDLISYICHLPNLFGHGLAKLNLRNHSMIYIEVGC